MGSLQDELKKQIARLGLVHPVAEEVTPLPPQSTLAEQRKLAGIVETAKEVSSSSAPPVEKAEPTS